MAAGQGKRCGRIALLAVLVALIQRIFSEPKFW